MSRQSRQENILNIIASTEVYTQTDLTEKLINFGVNVTQATVSRDIKELGLTKVMTSSRKYKYVFNDQKDSKLDKLHNLFRQCTLSITSAENLIVIKTISGSANSACVLVDKLMLENILGTIAGDDTILIIVSSKDKTQTILDELKNLIDQ